MRRKLAIGGMAEVWEAFDETLHRSVAVKVIRQSVSSAANFNERFTREARMAAGLEHPNILPIYDYGEESETSYLVMPLLSGGSLKDVIKDASGPLPPEVAIELLSGIGSALDHAHSKGVLHRDVKPANVLVEQTGSLMLADFGLAKSAAGSSSLTQTGVVLGTPLYMSPEQSLGHTLDARSDQYALGVIAFELLTGAVPFNADSPLAVLHMHIQAPPPSVTARNCNLPAAVDAVVARALAKKPADRYASCTELVTALAEALAVNVPRARNPLSSVSLPRQTTAFDERPTVKGLLPLPLPPAEKLEEAESVISPPPLPVPTPRGGISRAQGISLGALAAMLVGAFFLLRGTGDEPAPKMPTPIPSLATTPTAAPSPTVEPIRVIETAPLAPTPAGTYSLEGGRRRVVEVTVPYRPNERVPVRVQIDYATIDSFEIRDTPTRKHFDAARKDPADTYKSKIVYTYTNRSPREYRCNYVTTLLGANGQPLGTDSQERTLNSNQVADTNSSSLKTRTLGYRDARTVKLRFEMKKRD